MKEMLVGRLVSILISTAGPVIVREAVNALLAVVENAVIKSENAMDDAIILPVIDAIRASMGPPDGIS